MSNSGIEAIDGSFHEILLPESAMQCVADGFRFTEGPAWFADGQFLLFSDIPASTIYRWKQGEGHSLWRQPSRHANGNTVDLQGRLLTCEHGSRTLTRTEADGTVVTLASTHGGKRLNSPNDVVVKRDGTIWFTDPPYGIKPSMSEQRANHVFRLDPLCRGVSRPKEAEDLYAEPVSVVADCSRPNGLCFSPDEKLLYVADSDTAIHHIRVFQVQPDNTLIGGEVFATVDPGLPDGIRTDSAGRLYSTSAEGVHVFSPDGKLLGKLRTPETASNCQFGGHDGQTLFITATTRVWAVRLAVGGAK